jgi:hypothetical protein
MRDGTTRDFLHEGRPGGSYSKGVTYKEGWVVVTDEWGKETAFPADLVERVESEPEHRPW